ncbi:hypothetical protein GCM10025880_58340 [Methylorubrum aminovorans]|nr:hypothetical protein GCM10025880_58340 [Methylorubrum aminovorans]
MRLGFPGLSRDDARWGADGAGHEADQGDEPGGRAGRPRASVSKAATISASPVRTASGTLKAAWTEGFRRRIGASSKQGRSSWTREAQCSSSMAAAAASEAVGSSSPQA